MAASSFDPLKAAREELAGLVDVQRTLTQKENRAEEAMGLAEHELNAIRKIVGYLRISMDAMRRRIDELEREQQHAKSP